MCRWIAYRGDAVAMEKFVTAPEHSLLAQSLRAIESAGQTNGDGFGLGWYGMHDDPGIYREVRPAWSDENMRHLCRHIHSRLFFAHVRASTGTPTTRPNCHPFSHGRWMFMHNGQIGDWTRIRRRVEGMIPDSFYASRVGTTDSEAAFLAILGAGGVDDPVAATQRTLARLNKIVEESDTTEPVRFTAALADGRNMYAFRYASDDTANTLYYRDDGGNVVVVSEPLDMDRKHWITVPPGHMISAREGEPGRLIPFLVGENAATG
jgi:predicted glutamine amidotransferase